MFLRYVPQSALLLVLCGLNCANEISFFECQDDSDCSGHPAAARGVNLHCTRDNLCVIGSPIVSLCSETYPSSSPADAVLIGALVNRDVGTDFFKVVSYKLAIDEINQQRSRPRYPPLSLRICEIGTDPADPQKSMQLLMRDPNIVAVLGPSNSRDVVAIKNEVLQSGIPIVSPSATAPELSLLGDRNGPVNGLFYRVVTSDDEQGPVLAAIAVEEIKRNGRTPNFGLIYADDAYGRGFKTAVLKRLEDLKYDARPKAYFTETVGGPDQQAIDQTVDVFLSGVQGIDLIALPNRYSVALIQSIALHAQRNQVRQVFMGEGGKYESVRQLCTHPRAEVRDFLSRIHGSAPTINQKHPWFEYFAQSFQNRSNGFSSNATVYTAYAYDAVYAIALAIGAAAPDVTKMRIRERLARLNGCLIADSSKQHISVGRDAYLESLRLLDAQSGGLVLTGLSGEICFTPHGDRVNGSYEHWWINTGRQAFEQEHAVP